MNELYISSEIKKDTIADKFVECVKSIPKEVGLKYNYICLLTTRGFVNVRVDAVYPDGYSSEGVFYTFSPFTAVIEEDYNDIKNMEKEVESKIGKEIN